MTSPLQLCKVLDGGTYHTALLRFPLRASAGPVLSGLLLREARGRQRLQVTTIFMLGGKPRAQSAVGFVEFQHHSNLINDTHGLRILMGIDCTLSFFTAGYVRT